MAGKKSTMEPYGHFSKNSKIERHWKNYSIPISTNRERVMSFDPYASMTFSPMKYGIKELRLNVNPPCKDWILENFVSFVRDEFSSEHKSDFIENWPPINLPTLSFSDSELFNIFKENESLEALNISINPEMSPQEISEAIFDILCHTKIGSKKNQENNSKKEFINFTSEKIKNRSRLLFVIPGFPFKDQNLFRVPLEPDTPDFSELSFLFRLHRLTQAIYQVHPYGTDVIVLTDGTLYSDIFDVSKESANIYQRKLIEYRNLLNLQGTVSFLPLQEAIEKMNINDGFTVIREIIRESLLDVFENSKGEVKKLVDSLIVAMKRNLNSRKYASKLSNKEIWDAIYSDNNSATCPNQSFWHEIHLKATISAIEYASTNLALKYTDLIRKFFPDAIRCTIHPKREQFSLNGDGGNYAWNGVAWSEKWPNSIEDIQVKSITELHKFGEIKLVQFEKSKQPCFYTKVETSPNIQLAKEILPPNGWRLREVHGRQFSESDLKDLRDLGRNDPFFNWERVNQNESHFKNILTYRLDHYKKYGFGVHGVWKDNELIGQFGMQVYDERKQLIELVIFLGKNYVNQGLGKHLVNFAISKCKKLGIHDFLGVVRKDNKPALKLLKNYEISFVKETNHFKHDSIVYKVHVI